MALEIATYISGLNTANPTASDPIAEGDNHIRLIKSALKNTFPNVADAVTPTAAELNYVSGVTSALQAQLNAKAPLASPALTGTPTAPTAAVGTNTTQIATTAYVNAEIANDAPTKTGGGASGTWGINISGNAGSATSAIALSTGASNWNNNGTIANVVGLLAWKNYGNGHVIFDASQGTAPNGAGVNNTNPSNYWSSTFPTLMGWNGSSTYGVRVDSARVADSVSSVSASAVLSATAGAGAGEVGTYAFCANPTNENSAFAAGATIAGSRLRYVAIYRQSSGTMSVEYYGTPSGTWRVMSHIQNYLNWGVGMGLVLRIS